MSMRLAILKVAKLCQYGTLFRSTMPWSIRKKWSSKGSEREKCRM